MKLDQLKKLIKDSVREVVREELQKHGLYDRSGDSLDYSFKNTPTTANLNFAPSTTSGGFRPEIGRVYPPAGLNSFLQETAKSMNSEELRMLNGNTTQDIGGFNPYDGINSSVPNELPGEIPAHAIPDFSKMMGLMNK